MSAQAAETFDRWRARVLRDTAKDAALFHGLIGPSPVPGALTATGPPGVVVIAANGAMERLLRRSDLVGADVSVLTDPTDLPPDFEVIERIRANQVDVLFRRRRYLCGDGTTVTVNASSVVADNRDGYSLHVAAFVEPGRTEWIQARIRQDDELNAALADVRAALLRGDSTDSVFGLICDCTRDLLRAESAGLLELDGDFVQVRATDHHRPPGQTFGGRRWRVADDNFGAAMRSGRTARYKVPRARIEHAGGHVAPTVASDAEIHMAVAPVEATARPFGALVVRRALIGFTDTEIAVLEAFSAGVSDALTVAEARADLERLRVLEVRQEIARNLHDEVIQDLIGVRLGLVALVPAAEDLEVAARLRELRDELNEATIRLRDVVAGLDAALTPETFGDTLRSLTRSRAERHGIGWSVELVGTPDVVGDEARADLLRVLNEAVSNVVRHADATQVDVTLRIDGSGLRLTVEDDGVGPERAATATGMGLRNLRARAEGRGGGCSIGDRTDGGTRLEWWIPWAPGG